MSDPESYIDRCVVASKSIDVDELSGSAVGQRIGRGTLFAMRQLGTLTVSGSEVHCGLKVPTRDSSDASIRLQLELEAIERLLSRMPEHHATVPRFMTILAIEGKPSAAAILTEDATRGGTLPIFSLGSLLTRSDRARSIARAFKGVPNTRVNQADIDHSLAFRVGEEERFLDFTPPPVRYTGGFADNPIADRIYDLLGADELTVTVSEESPLARSLEGAGVV